MECVVSATPQKDNQLVIRRRSSIAHVSKYKAKLIKNTENIPGYLVLQEGEIIDVLDVENDKEFPDSYYCHKDDQFGYIRANILQIMGENQLTLG